MGIWFQDINVDMLNEHMRTNMLEHLDIVFIEVGEDFIKAKMPVDNRTTQPYGILHGGASVALAESLGSAAATLCLDVNQQICVGLEVNANHLRAVGGGFVVGVAKAIHVGRQTQVWEVKIYDEKDKLVCVSRLTLANLDKKLLGT